MKWPGKLGIEQISVACKKSLVDYLHIFIFHNPRALKSFNIQYYFPGK